jgi:hypothetical protein
MITLGPPSFPIVSSLVNAAMIFDNQRFSQKVADDLLLLCIIPAIIPISVTSDHRFQALLHSLNNRNQIPPPPTTIKQCILNRCHLFWPHNDVLMYQAVTHIHLSCDGWTSPPETMAVLGIIAHFTSHAGT